MDIPDSWTKIKPSDYKKFFLFDTDDMLDAFLKPIDGGVLLITLTYFGEDEGSFIEEYHAQVNEIDKMVKELESSNKNWREKSLVKPIVSKFITANGKKIYFNVMEASNNNDNLVLQIYFKINNDIYCFGTVISKQWTTASEIAENNPSAKDILAVVSKIIK